MKSILVIGLGRFGRHLCQKFMSLHNEVMIVDRDEAAVTALAGDVTSAQIADCTDETVLRSLGVQNFDLCFVCIGSDFQSSLLITALLKDMGARRVISKANRDIHARLLLRNGADEVVYPEKQLAAWTAIRCTSDHILDYIDLDGDYSIFELDIPAEWSGRTVVELDIRRRHGINILGIRENGKMNMSVTPDTVLRSGNSMLVLGHERAVRKCFRI